MIETAAGIAKRAFYLLSGIVALGLTTGGAVGIVLYGWDSDVTGMLAAGIATAPVAFAIHQAARWVVRG